MKSRDKLLSGLHAQCRDIEARWAETGWREQALAELGEALQALPEFERVAALLRPGLSERQFLDVCVPIERETSRIRVRDEDMLPDESDRADPASPPMPVILVTDNIRSAFNIGGLFRSAECFGFEALWLCGYSATPEHPNVQRAAMGCAELVPWRHFRDAGAALDALDRPVIALETSREATPLPALQAEFPCAVLIGNERFGLSPELLARTQVVRIPLHGRKNSLNVVSAFTVAAAAIRERWHGA